MHGIETTTGDEAYLRLLQLVAATGQLASPRQQPASAIHDVTIVIHDPVKAPPVGVRTGYAYKIAATETAQLLAGVSCLEQLDAASAGRFSRYADQGRLRGAYGPRLHQQLPRVEKQLKADHATRQAVATIWRSSDDAQSNDVPCTVALTFRILENKLELKVHMRSNDLVLGTPYDWFQFSRLQLAMAEVVGLKPGRYVHHVDNLHVYQRDEDRARKFREGGEQLEAGHQLGHDDQGESAFLGRGMHPFNTWGQVQTNALAVLRGSQSAFRRFRWYHGQVPPMLDGSVVCHNCRYIADRGSARHTGGVDQWICGVCQPLDYPALTV